MLPLIVAFCGFYVSGSGARLSNDATEVVLMRDGTRTVLAMQNDYRGPLEDFAMVVPVPVVLHDGDVKTLRPEVFEHVDALGSPRLVEYWEQDPCPAPVLYGVGDGIGVGYAGSVAGAVGYGMGAGRGTVKVEATFDVAEYQIVILSATDSAGLEDWLTANKYKIPAGAEPLLRPYVEGGSKFFVAKVNPAKVHMDHGHAALSPLRFDYDSEEFSLPIRLGLASSSGTQDLIVNILSRDTRYEVANYKNVFIPTNVDVKNAVKARFSEFYAALFDKTIEANPGAVVTEYAWTATRGYHCDPCPELDVTNQDIAELGGDIIGKGIENHFVMTRLHARYGAKDMKDDLRFREAAPVTGGREEWSRKGLEYGATPAAKNFFQARYAIRHYWSGKITCAHPQRYVWGGPPDGVDSSTIAAQKLAFAPRGRLALGSVIGRDLWEIGVKKARKGPSTKAKAMGLGALVLLGLGVVLVRRRR